MITDTQRLQWLAARVTYLEHKDKHGTPAIKLGIGEGGYWPQAEDDMGMSQIEDLCGLDLIEFIDEMIRRES